MSNKKHPNSNGILWLLLSITITFLSTYLNYLVITSKLQAEQVMIQKQLNMTEIRLANKITSISDRQNKLTFTFMETFGNAIRKEGK